MTWVPVALVLGVLVVLGAASLPYGVEPLEDLYRLNRLYDHDDPYMALLPLDDVDSRSDDGVEGVDGDSLWAGTDVDTSLYNSPLYSETQVRDQEHLEHSALQGLHAVAGGTAEGQPPQKQVKTDKPLPAYCNPPNPCPVGKTAADNCVENFENTMDNNKEILAHQDCPCDTEHMFHCPAGQQTVTSKGVGGQAAFSKVMSQLAQLNADDDLTLANNPYLAQGVKRDKLVAKKSPSLLRHKRSQEEMDYNPYLQGRMLETAAKKSPEMIHPA